ncbi:Uncharacterised protein [uncultured archaeon]|nr:Uncharacterised protein [uncultured archaeon]
MVKTSSRYLYYSFEGDFETANNRAKEYAQNFLGESQMSESGFYLFKDEESPSRLIIKCTTKKADLIIASIALKTCEENLKLLRISGTIRSMKTKTRKSSKQPKIQRN